MTEIVKHQGGALSLGAMAVPDAWRFAEALAGSGMLPRQYQNNPASVLWALEYGRAIGLDVITTTQSVHVIQGRATASADLMASLTRRAGHRMRIVGDDRRAEVVIFRADDPEFEFRTVWDWAKAERAGLVKKDTWRQFPGAMLRARAISECVRMACPEVLHGSIYTPEELGVRVDDSGSPLEAEVQRSRPTEPAVDAWSSPAPAEQQTVAIKGRSQPAQDIADAAGTTTSRECVQDLYRQAHTEGLLGETVKTGDRELLELGAYLIARGQDLAAPKLEQQDDGEVVDGEVVPDAPADEHAAAVAELRAVANAAGLGGDFDTEAHAALGCALDDAAPAAIRRLAATIRGQAGR